MLSAEFVDKCRSFDSTFCLSEITCDEEMRMEPADDSPRSKPVGGKVVVLVTDGDVYVKAVRVNGPPGASKPERLVPTDKNQVRTVKPWTNPLSLTIKYLPQPGCFPCQSNFMSFSQRDLHLAKGARVWAFD